MLKIVGTIVGLGVLAGGTYYLVQDVQLEPAATPATIVQPLATESAEPAAAALAAEAAVQTNTQKPKPLPIVTTIPTRSIGGTMASFTGKIIPNALEVTWWYEYGKTTSLGSSTPPKTVRSPAPKMTFLAPFYVTKLEPKTVYYYRLVVKSQNGTTNGNTVSITTR